MSKAKEKQGGCDNGAAAEIQSAAGAITEAAGDNEADGPNLESTDLADQFDEDFVEATEGDLDENADEASEMVNGGQDRDENEAEDVDEDATVEDVDDAVRDAATKIPSQSTVIAFTESGNQVVFAEVASMEMEAAVVAVRLKPVGDDRIIERRQGGVAVQEEWARVRRRAPESVPWANILLGHAAVQPEITETERRGRRGQQREPSWIISDDVQAHAREQLLAWDRR